MKVLFISYWYPSKNNPLKGVFVKKHAFAAAVENEVYILSLVIENSTKFYKKEILNFKDERGLNNTQIIISSKYYKLFHLLLFFQYRLLKIEATKIVAGFKPQIIHSNVLYPAAILGYKLSKHYTLPHIITEHWSKVNKFMGKSLYARMGKKAYSQAKAVTVVSDFLKENILTYIDPLRTHVVPNVVYTSLFSFKPKAICSDTITFTIVAHWTNPKRPDLVFYGLNKFANHTTKKIVLNVIGEGYLIHELKTKIWQFKVNYLGNKTPYELADTLQKSDYFLHASEIETFSIVIAEALSTGTPVLASNVGAISELINETNGVLTTNTVENWEKSLITLTGKQFNHELIANSTEKFSEKNIGEQFTRIYKRIIV